MQTKKQEKQLKSKIVNELPYLKSKPEHWVVVVEVGDGEDDEGQDPDNHIMDVLCTLNSQKIYLK